MAENRSVNRDVPQRDVFVSRAAADLARWSAYTLTVLLLAGAGTVGCRRLARALQQPLDGPTLLLIGVVASGAAAASRLLLRRPGAADDAARKWQWIVSLGLAVWGISLSLSGTHFSGLLLLWCILVGEEAWAWWGVWRPARRIGGPAEDRRPQGTSDEAPGPSANPSYRLTPDRASSASEDVLQEFIRSREEGGGELLRGWMRVGLAPGQRSATVHLAFCPPFARTPTITVSQQEGPSARIKEAQVLPFGARLDLKLSQATDRRVSVLLEIVARADAAVESTDPARTSRPGE